LPHNRGLGRDYDDRNQNRKEEMKRGAAVIRNNDNINDEAFGVNDVQQSMIGRGGTHNPDNKFSYTLLKKLLDEENSKKF
jgi:hypothetical protein